jgi:hypothetical protein
MEELASAPEAATTTAQGDMVPVSESSDHYIKRVVRVRKQRQELFGWRLSPIDKALYVIAIDETVNYAPSAAFRSGIKFGDRITHVAGNSVSYKSDLYAMMTELKDSVEVWPVHAGPRCTTASRVLLASEGLHAFHTPTGASRLDRDSAFYCTFLRLEYPDLG